jgi:hypothetical protein
VSGGYRESFVSGSYSSCFDPSCDCQMQRVKRPKRNSSKTDQKIACSDGVLIFQRMHFKKSLRDILFERCCSLSLYADINLAVSTTTAEKAA